MTIMTDLHFDSWLDYFFAVPEVEQQAYPKRPSLLQEVGVLLTHKAVYAEEEVKAWMRANFLTGEQLNKSFYKSWNSLKEKSDIELLRDKVLHYFSTYGMQELGLYTQDMIYIPEHVLNMPEKVGFRVLSTLSFEEAITKCLDALQQGIALKQETIVDILNILEDCQYTFLPEDIQSISNREALVLIADKTGILPNKGDDLFRYIFYKATGGSTLVINDKASKLAIANTQYALPPLSTKQCQELAKSYQRRKAIWLSIKTANRKANASTVNNLNKLSKFFHEPMKPDVIGSLTSEVYTQQTVIEAANKATNYRLIKTIQALRLYKSQPNHYLYSIRNGKSWCTQEPKPKEKTILKQYEKYEEWLLTILKYRLKDMKVYCPSHIRYAIPTSEKQFLGPIPYGTKISPPQLEEGQYLLVGIFWEGDGTDLDLSSTSVNTKVGWNTTYRTNDYGLLHSGDITSGPNGATEWLYSKKINTPYLVSNNLYAKGFVNDVSFKLIIAYGDDKDINNVEKEDRYLVDPNKVLFETEVPINKGQVNLGLLKPDLSFQILKGEGQQTRVSSSNPTLNEAMLNRLDNLVYVDDLFTLVDSPEECDVDLSLEGLSTASFLELLKDK